MRKDYLLFLETIQQECLDIEAIKSKGLTFEDLNSNMEKKKALLLSLLNIGEYTNKIPIDVKLKWSEVDWIKMVGIRNRIAHDYLGVDLAIVWKIIQYDIPAILPALKEIIAQEQF
ncbi:MAG: HepT-like ribonuclease domain-containing protein [Chitinophagales bacterium]